MTVAAAPLPLSADQGRRSCSARRLPRATSGVIDVFPKWWLSFERWSATPHAVASPRPDPHLDGLAVLREADEGGDVEVPAGPGRGPRRGRRLAARWGQLSPSDLAASPPPNHSHHPARCPGSQPVWCCPASRVGGEADRLPRGHQDSGPHANGHAHDQLLAAGEVELAGSTQRPTPPEGTRRSRLATPGRERWRSHGPRSS